MNTDPVTDRSAFVRAVEELEASGKKEELAQVLARGIERLERERGKFVAGRPVTLIIADPQKQLDAADPEAAPARATAQTSAQQRHLAELDEQNARFTATAPELAFAFGRQAKGDGVIGKLFEHLVVETSA